MDDSFIHLLRLASNMHHHLICFIEDLLFGYNERASQNFEDPSSRSHGKYSHIMCGSSYESSSMSCGPSSADTQLLGCSRSLYQHEDPNVYRISIAPPLASQFFFQGLMVPLHGLKLGFRLLSNLFRCYYNCIKHRLCQIRGFLSRLNKTLQGSSNDIGWLQKIDEFPPVEDGTMHFMELLNNKEGFPIEAFAKTICNYKESRLQMGLACHIAKIHSEASVEKNAWELKVYIEELFWGSGGKKVLLLGHSKGGVDAAAALSIYWPELKGKVAGLALVQSPYGGSPIAADILREGQLADKEARRIMEFIICKVIKGDMRALDDLTYEKRKDFISKHRLPLGEIPMISFHTEARIAPAVLATMSHIAHAELPWLPLPSCVLSANEIYSFQGGRKVPVVIPLAAAMAVSALHLKLRYGETSDGLVTRQDAEVPGSTVIRLPRKLDHAWMVYSSMKRDETEADPSEMCEALLTMLVEMGRRKQVELNTA